MGQAKKIVVGKHDEAAAVAEQIIDAEADEVVLSVPKFSRLAEAIANFHLLKREAEALRKKLTIESVDDHVIELCRKSRIECVNPFFTRGARQLSDIVVRKGKQRGGAAGAGSRSGTEQEGTDGKQEVRPGKASGVFSHFRIRLRFPFRGMGGLIVASWKRPIFLGIAVVVVAALLFAVLSFLPRAEVRLVAAKTAWSFKNTVRADATLTAADSEAFKIPAQMFTETKNAQFTFPAQGKRNVQRKAKGVIIVYNAFSSTPQTLVAQTRFLAPDGKIFRLANGITVPGAKVAGGKIEPSSIDAAVVADEPGAAYNIGPVTRFSIPGFEGTPKFQGFYGEAKAPMTGGFVGEAFFPTNEDERKAKEESRRRLEATVRDLVRMRLPEHLKVPQGADQFSILNERVDTEVREDRTFSVFVEGQLSLFAFDEKDLIRILEEKARREAGAPLVAKGHELSYGAPQLDFKDRTMAFPVEYKGLFAREMNIGQLKSQILGLREQDLKARLFSLPGLDRAHVSLWPFWVRRVPKSLSRVSITLE